MGHQSRGADADGKFKIGRIAPGRYIVQASSEKGMATAEIDTARLGGNSFELVLKPVETLAVDALKLPHDKQLGLLIYDDKNVLTATRNLWVRFIYNIELPAGRYRYEVLDEMKPWDTGTFTVGIGGKPRIVVK